MVRPNPLKPMERNTYEDILNNFESFCDNFEVAAAERFSGQDNDSRQPVDNAEVQRVTPTIVREVNTVGEEDIITRTTAIDVQASELPEV